MAAAQRRIIFTFILTMTLVGCASGQEPISPDLRSGRFGSLSIEELTIAETEAFQYLQRPRVLGVSKPVWNELQAFASDISSTPGSDSGYAPSVSTGSTRTSLPVLGALGSSGKLRLTDILESTSNKSIAGTDSPAMLTPSKDGAPLTIRITGEGLYRKTDNSDRNDDNDIDADDWEASAITRYTPPILPGFLVHTYLSQQHKHRVLLDDSIVLTPSLRGSFSNSELTMQLDPRQIPDLHRGGMHTLTVLVGRNWVQAPIRFGPARPGTFLGPIISETRLLKNGKDKAKWLVEVVGRNLPISFLNMYARINGNRAYLHGTFATAEDSVAFIHIPMGSLKTSGPNSLVLATPFGATFSEF
ncbi:MAG: hypothetical protein H7338_11975 [Candidatus Sericytochromatia bacterium]|nr:hypothetical protein [Candidatus Sericytochromatia bacterium]